MIQLLLTNALVDSLLLTFVFCRLQLQKVRILSFLTLFLPLLVLSKAVTDTYALGCRILLINFSWIVSEI